MTILSRWVFGSRGIHSPARSTDKRKEKGMLYVKFPNGYLSPISAEQIAKYNLAAGMLTPFSRLPIVAG
jgi:hypothetical protein